MQRITVSFDPSDYVWLKMQGEEGGDTGIAAVLRKLVREQRKREATRPRAEDEGKA